MDNSRVQIIMPVYNAEKYLGRSLDSLVNQTFKDWRVIIVDDASNDSSREIIETYASRDSRFTKVFLSENGGASNARNTALGCLSYECEYTAFLDADDYWEPDMLQHMVQVASEKDTDVTQCRFIYDFPGGKQVLPVGAFRKSVNLYGKGLRKVYRRMMTGINMNHVCMKLIKTQLLEGMKFDMELKTAEDLKFCVQLFKKVKSYCFTDKVLYHYCRNEESLTGRGLAFGAKMSANRKVSRELCAALPDWGIDNIFYRLLSLSRPYIITVSKVFRIIREKFLK